MPFAKIRLGQFRSESSTTIVGTTPVYTREPYHIPAFENGVLEILPWNAGNADNQAKITCQWCEAMPGRYPVVATAAADTSLFFVSDPSLVMTISDVTTDTSPIPNARWRNMVIPVAKAAFLRVEIVLSGTTPEMDFELILRIPTEE